MFSRRLALLCWFAAPFLLASSGSAQQPAPVAEAPKPEAPEPVTEANFGVQAADAEQLVATIGLELDFQEVSEEVGEALDKADVQADELMERAASLDQRRMMNSEVNALDSELGLLDARTNRYIERAATLAKKLAALSVQADASIDLWSDAVRAARDPSVPKQVRTRSVRILRALRTAREQIEKAQGNLLELQSRGLDVLDEVDQARRIVKAAQDETAKNVFERQDPPLWERQVAPSTDGEDATEDSYEIGFSWPAVTNYLRQSRVAIAAQLLLVMLLGFLFGRLRKVLEERIEKRQQAAPIPWEDRAMEAFRHPWLAALLVGLASVRWLHPNRMADLIVVSWLATIPVWFVVLKDLAPRPFQRPLAGLALLGTLHIVLTVTSGHPHIERLLLLLQLALTGAGAGWMIRFLRGADVPKRTQNEIWFSATELWIHVMVAVSIGGFAATILGYRYLGQEAALVVTVGTIAATYFVALARILEAWVVTAIHIGRLDGLRMIRANRDLVSKVLKRVIQIVAVFWFVWGLSDMTSAWRPFAEAIQRALESDLGFGLVETGVTFFDLLGFFFILWVSWVISRVVSFVLMEEFLPRLNMKAGAPYALTTFTRYAIIAIGFVAALAVLGLSLDKVTIVLSALGVGVGFGLQNLVNNFVSGFVLLTERPIRLRDKVEINGVLGNVSSIGIRASTIRTFDGAEVIVPNGDLISNQLVNWTLAARQQRVTIPVGVAYGTDPSQVLTILRRVASENESVFKDPAPLALFRGFGDSSLDFELRVFMDPSNVLDVPSALHVAIYSALHEASIEIPFPQRDLHVRSMPGDRTPSTPSDETTSKEDEPVSENSEGSQ
jgi:small-conductance mechanosensitive channel